MQCNPMSCLQLWTYSDSHMGGLVIIFWAHTCVSWPVSLCPPQSDGLRCNALELEFSSNSAVNVVAWNDLFHVGNLVALIDSPWFPVSPPISIWSLTTFTLHISKSSFDCKGNYDADNSFNIQYSKGWDLWFTWLKIQPQPIIYLNSDTISPLSLLFSRLTQPMFLILKHCLLLQDGAFLI